MKFRISILVIVASTALVIGLINFLLSDNAPSKLATSVAQNSPEKNEVVKFEANKIMASSSSKPSIKEEEEEVDEDGDDEDEDEEDIEDQREVLQGKVPDIKNDIEKEESSKGMNEKDIQIINGVAKLSDGELAKEIESLTTRIANENLLSQLENGDLPKEKEAEAKLLLERFALLGLEKTRRRFMEIEPELKDPLYAHRESLQEIRELLNDN